MPQSINPNDAKPWTQLSKTEVYQLKLKIDEALKPYGAGAVSWQTSWSRLVIRKYDHRYSADRSVIFEVFIKDEADWLAQQAAIIQELQQLQQRS